MQLPQALTELLTNAFFYKILTLILSVLLIMSILVQQRGSGLGGAFGGEGTVYRTRRGAEKFLFRSTIVLSILYIITTIASILVAR